MRPFTKQAMKIEVAPWIKDYVVNMDELYTELSLEKIDYKLQGEDISVVDDYRELFAKCIEKKQNQSEPVHSVSESDSLHELDSLESDDICCHCFGKPKSKLTQRVKRIKTKKMFTQSNTGEKILGKGDPGMGKTTWSKKVAWDWAQGVFTAFSIVFFVFLKVVKPGAAIENVIIEQNSYMKGLKMTDRKLENILEKFGNRCLLILDGLDEHTLGTNQDVLKIIRGEKLLSCNIIVTSRPHSTKQIEKYFPVILRVEGFTKNKAKQFAIKILNDELKVKTVLKFNPVDSKAYGDIPIYKCPILLSFLCVLMREDDIDLSTGGMHIGEIYYRMVRCLYKKFTIREGIDFEKGTFYEIIMLIGKLAFETLLSGHPLLQRKEVMAKVGRYAFDYGLLIGHEDAHKLFQDETADIYITFPHQSLREFLGAFYFVGSLAKDDKSKSSGATDDNGPIFLINPLFLRFCLWILKDEKYQIFKNSSKIYNSLVTHSVGILNNKQLNTNQIAELFPALDIESASFRKDKLHCQFLKDILARCDAFSILYLESPEVLDWLLESIDPVDLRMVHIENRRGDEWSFPFNSVRLTHLHVEYVQFREPFWETMEDGLLSGLHYLSLIYCRSNHLILGFLFEHTWPQLRYLNLQGIKFRATDFKTLCFACNGNEKKLPNLTSLCFSIAADMRMETVTENVFALPWLNLKSLSFQCRPADLGEQLYTSLNAKNLPSVTSLGFDLNLFNARLEKFSLRKLPGVKSLVLSHCYLHFDP